MGTYIPFTEEQREQARMTDLSAFLERCGETLKRSGSEQMWLDHGQKVTIRGNLWFHQYEQVGGDAIDFARRFYGMAYPEAVQLMLSMGIGTIREPVEPFAKKPLKIPPKYDNMSRVYGYLLRRRGIAKEVLDAFAYRGLIYESADYHNAVFVGVDTVLSKLNAFLDTELEQVICFDGGIDAELFVREESAIFLILPEEDATKNFVASLMIQNLARELFSVANEHGGKLPNRAVFFCDELGTMPPFDILPLFSAGRSRRLTLVPIIQSLAQLEKNYGKEGAEILADNCQDTIFGGFAPNSQTANTLSTNLGSRTVLSGSVTQGKDSNSQSLQMMERPLMSPDELKSMPKGSFVVMKTGTHPMKTKLKLFFQWGISFGQPLEMPDLGSRPVHYASKQDLELAILKAYPIIQNTPPVKPTAKTMPTVTINTEE